MTVVNPAAGQLGVPLNVLAFGADGTGTTDSTTAVQNAINQASATAGTNGKTDVVLPSGYTFQLSALNMKNGVRVNAYGATITPGGSASGAGGSNPNIPTGLIIAPSGIQVLRFEVAGGLWVGNGTERSYLINENVHTVSAADITLRDMFVTNWGWGFASLAGSTRSRVIDNVFQGAASATLGTLNVTISGGTNFTVTAGGTFTPPTSFPTTYAVSGGGVPAGTTLTFTSATAGTLTNAGTNGAQTLTISNLFNSNVLQFPDFVASGQSNTTDCIVHRNIILHQDCIGAAVAFTGTASSTSPARANVTNNILGAGGNNAGVVDFEGSTGSEKGQITVAHNQIRGIPTGTITTGKAFVLSLGYGHMQIKENVIDMSAAGYTSGASGIFYATADGVPQGPIDITENSYVPNANGGGWISNTNSLSLPLVSYRGNRLSAGASQGTVQLSGGTATVSTAEIQTGDNISLTVVTPAGTRGVVQLGTIVGGTSFVINSIQPGTASTLQGSDTSTVFWKIEH